jgi:predicted peptidase
MKTIRLICIVYIFTFLVGCAQMEKSKMKSQPAAGQHPCAFEKKIRKTVGCNYLLFLPEGYGTEKQPWPLLMFLHGVGERGNDLRLVKKHGPPKLVEKQTDFGFIVLSPQCPEDGWWPEETEVLINLLDDVVSRYDVDAERIYLTGLSMGGYGAWALAATYPERFAAVAPICGGGSLYMALKLKETPVWVFHGAKDNIIPLEESEKMVDAINKFGGNAKLTVYPDAGHDSWTATYDNQELYDWFLKHRKSGKEK